MLVTVGGLGGGMAIRSGKAPGFTGYFNGTYKVLLPPYRSESILSLFLIQGQIYLRKNDGEQAADSFSKAIENGSTFVDAYLSLCVVRLKTKDLQNARRLLGKVLALEAAHAEAYILLGEIHLMEREFDAAREAFVRAVAFDFTQVRATFGLGRSFLLTKEYQKAIGPLNQTIEWAPLHLPIYVEAHYTLPMAQIKLKNFAVARSYLKKGLELNPDYPNAAAKLARLESTIASAKN